jgi:hypothetical protein
MTLPPPAAIILRMGTPDISLKGTAERQLIVLVEVMTEAFEDWCEDAGAVEAAYRGWCGAPRDRQAYLAYVTALEHEESAASRYATAVADWKCCAAA